MARSFVVYEPSSPTILGPVSSSPDRVEEATRRPTDDMAALDEERYG